MRQEVGGRRLGRTGRGGLAALLVLLAAPAGAAPPRVPEPLPGGAAVLDRYVEATGGLAAHDRISTRVTRMTVTLPDRRETYQSVEYRARPNKTYSRYRSATAGTVETGCDGAVAWTLASAAGPSVKRGAALAEALRDATFDRLVYWRTTYDSARVTGVETVGGRACYAVVLTPRVGRPQTADFDRRTGLLVRLRSVVDDPAGPAPVETLPGDYRRVDGILLPFRTEAEVRGVRRIVAVESVRQNTPLPARRFEPPAEVRRLLQAGK